jgi:hypothetical protein
MDTFDSTFFNALAEISDLALHGNEDGCIDLPVQDNELSISDLCTATTLDSAFIFLAHKFATTLSKRSNGRYLFEEDFGVRSWQIFSYSKGREGRKQLHIRFDAYPPNRLISSPWGVSIGLGFDFRGEKGIHAACVDDYEAFNEKVFCEAELFDVTFGSLGGYAEPTEAFKETVTAEKAWQTVPSILDHWLFFGRRISSDNIAAYGPLEGFVDECTRVFDVICEAGYYD